MPAGLSLDTATGIIAGTPAAVSAAADYVITASNAAGSALDTVNIRVIAPPTGLSYATNPAVYTERRAITPNAPAVTGLVSTYASAPPLPAGLSLDTVTGILSGTPASASPAADYVVVASNLAGETRCTLSVAIQLLPPENLVYPEDTVHYPLGTDIVPNIPTVTGNVALFWASPALPLGLLLDEGSGMLWGRPSSSTPPTDYTVTATNAAGSTTTKLRISTGNAVSLRRGAGFPIFRLAIAGAAPWSLPLPAGETGTARVEILDISGRSLWNRQGAWGIGGAEWNWEGARGLRSPTGVVIVRVTLWDSKGKRVVMEQRKLPLLK
jgi:hypothetical protein